MCGLGLGWISGGLAALRSREQRRAALVWAAGAGLAALVALAVALPDRESLVYEPDRRPASCLRC